MKKIMVIIMVVIILFINIGCATTGNYYNNKGINSKKQFTDEMLGGVLEDLERKQNERLLYNFGGAILFGGVVFGIFYLGMITTSETPLPSSIYSWEGGVWFIPIVGSTFSALCGWAIGGKFYDETHKK